MGYWKKCKLGDVITLQRGHDLPKRKMIEGNIPVAGSNGIIGYHNQSTTKAPGITIGRSGNLGNAFLYKDDFWAHNTTLYVKDFKGNYEIFIYYFLKSFDFKQFNVGSAVPTLNRNHIHPLDVLLPPLPNQKAIASVLSNLDDKIDLLHCQNKTLEAMAETLFRQWFVEEAQEDWEEGFLGDITDINPTYHLKKGEISSYLEMKNVSTSTFNPEGWHKREFTSGMKFQNGDTLLARITPCLENGKTCFVTFLDEEEIGWGSTEYLVMRMKEPFHPYISYIIAKDKDFRDFAISSMSGSSGRQRAQANVIKEYNIKVPPLEIIEELNCQLAGTLPKLKNNANKIRTLEKLRDTLLPKLMSGEVRVKGVI